MNVLSFYFTNQIHNINYIEILKAYLRHVSVQVYRLQADQNASFQNQLPLISGYSCSYAYTRAYIYVHTYLRTYFTYVHVQPCIHIIYIYTYMHTYHIYIYIYTHYIILHYITYVSAITLMIMTVFETSVSSWNTESKINLTRTPGHGSSERGLLSVSQGVYSVYSWFMHSNLRLSYFECLAHVLIEGS